MQFSRLFAARCMLSSNSGTAEQVTMVAKVRAREEVLAPIPDIVGPAGLSSENRPLRNNPKFSRHHLPQSFLKYFPNVSCFGFSFAPRRKC
jgi:hypothetical protein